MSKKRPLEEEGQGPVPVAVPDEEETDDEARGGGKERESSASSYPELRTFLKQQFRAHGNGLRSRFHCLEAIFCLPEVLGDPFRCRVPGCDRPFVTAGQVPPSQAVARRSSSLISHIARRHRFEEQESWIKGAIGQFYRDHEAEGKRQKSAGSSLPSGLQKDSPGTNTTFLHYRPAQVGWAVPRQSSGVDVEYVVFGRRTGQMSTGSYSRREMMTVLEHVVDGRPRTDCFRLGDKLLAYDRYGSVGVEVPSKSTWRAIAGDLHALVKAKVRQALEQLISDLDGVGPFIHGHIEATMTESSCFLTLIGSFLDRTLELQRFVLGMKELPKRSCSASELDTFLQEQTTHWFGERKEMIRAHSEEHIVPCDVFVTLSSNETEILASTIPSIGVAMIRPASHRLNHAICSSFSRTKKLEGALKKVVKCVFAVLKDSTEFDLKWDMRQCFERAIIHLDSEWQCASELLNGIAKHHSQVRAYWTSQKRESGRGRSAAKGLSGELTPEEWEIVFQTASILEGVERIARRLRGLERESSFVDHNLDLLMVDLELRDVLECTTAGDEQASYKTADGKFLTGPSLNGAVKAFLETVRQLIAEGAAENCTDRGLELSVNLLHPAHGTLLTKEKAADQWETAVRHLTMNLTTEEVRHAQSAVERERREKSSVTSPAKNLSSHQEKLQQRAKALWAKQQGVRIVEDDAAQEEKTRDLAAEYYLRSVQGFYAEAASQLGDEVSVFEVWRLFRIRHPQETVPLRLARKFIAADASSYAYYKLLSRIRCLALMSSGRQSKEAKAIALANDSLFVAVNAHVIYYVAEVLAKRRELFERRRHSKNMEESAAAPQESIEDGNDAVSEISSCSDESAAVETDRTIIESAQKKVQSMKASQRESPPESAVKREDSDDDDDDDDDDDSLDFGLALLPTHDEKAEKALWSTLFGERGGPF